MLSKCANPACSQTFRYLHEGKLFLIQTAAGSRSNAKASTTNFSPSRALKHVWLCSSCCRGLTVLIDGGNDVRIARKPTRNALPESFFEVQARLAERELSSFLSVVTRLFGPEQAALSAQDWLDAFELSDNSPRPTARDWWAITVAASARLAARLAVAQQRKSERRENAAIPRRFS